MNPILGSNEFEMFRNYIESNSGIHLDLSKGYLIENRLDSIMKKQGCDSFSSLYFKASADPTKKLQEKIIEAMTTNETLWFRDYYPFCTLQNQLFPDLVQLIQQKKKDKIRIWSAACSTGQEPYSIAIAFQELIRAKRDVTLQNLEIIATDISSSVLEQAQKASYDSFAINRGLSNDIKNRYFTTDGKLWTLKDEIRNTVTFKKLNLLYDFRILGSMDIVFCRNVLIYFSDALKIEILSRISNLLQPSGVLFVGSSESVSNYNSDFEMKSFDKTIYYQVKRKK
ncbi:MAG TPA: protein-glutamate O-methyltransferase CheR [Chitinispirillaceae bacterium]|nr:protein-glutamate O-methyltransferase CheR [Chitinispirillaceae bacterium]